MAKDSPKTTAGELQKIVESRAQKALNKMVKQLLHHHMLFGRISRKIILAHPKTNSSIFSYQTRLELRMGLASTVRPEPYRERVATTPFTPMERFFLQQWRLVEPLKSSRK